MGCGKTAQTALVPLIRLFPWASSFAIDADPWVDYNDQGGDRMTPRELYFIKSAATGFRAALADLAGDDGDRILAEAMAALHEPYTKPLSNRDIAYYAAMLVAWQDRGSPEIWA